MQHEKSGRLDNSPLRVPMGLANLRGVSLLSAGIGPRTETDIHLHISHRYLYSDPRAHMEQPKRVGRAHEERG